MMDDSPCFPNIERAIERYFSATKEKFPTLLTYHPKIDCEHGRYLLLNDAPNSHVIHGTGSQLMWYLGVLNVAHLLNLTVVHLEWTAEHAADEKNSDRDKYWRFFEWEIPYSAYQTCSKSSPVRKNRFVYDLEPNQTLDQHHNGKEVFTINRHLQSRFDQFLSDIHHDATESEQNVGFTFYSRRTLTIVSSLMEVGAVFETRWWLQHRKDYDHSVGVWSGNYVRSNHYPSDYFQYLDSTATKNRRSNHVLLVRQRWALKSTLDIQCPSISINATLLIGVHIRHGDVVKRNEHGRIISGDLYRYIANSAYAPLLINIINGLPMYLKQNYLITIYSEGNVSDFVDILKPLRHALPESRCRISFFLNGRTSETFNRILRDDIVLIAHSTFSMAAGIFNSRQLKIGPSHNRARMHGLRNFIELQLDAKHTQFKITEQKTKLIQQRIEYVWQEKKAQQKTPYPLWLANYESDYPEQFMLI